MNTLKFKEISKLVLKYSICFLLFVICCVLVFFIIDKKAMFDFADGLQQQYTGYIYNGIMFRNIFRNIFIDHVFEYPMWDSTIGMGSDPTYFFNPLLTPLTSTISALVPVQYSEYAFELIVIFRLYLSGLAFICFAYEKDYKGMNAIAGAVVYVFSSTSFIVFMQMNFSSVYIIFPLLLLGADRVWKNKKSLLYVLVLIYSTISSFYFTYMMLILLVAYCLIRFFYEKVRTLKSFLSIFIRFVVLTLTSLLIGLGAVLPSIKNLSKLNRLKTHYDIDLISFETIRKFFFYGFSGIQAQSDALIGASSFIVIAAVCLFVSKKKEPVIKWCLSLCLLSFAFPFIGSVFNGFNYPTERYIFSLIICAAYLVTVSFDSIKLFKGKIWIITLCVSLLYCVIRCITVNNNTFSIISAVSLLIAVLFTGCFNQFCDRIKAHRNKLYMVVILITCVLIGYSCLHSYLVFSFISSDTAYKRVFIDGGMNLKQEVNDPNYRIDTLHKDITDQVMNSSMAAGINGFDFYQSNQSQHIEDYYTELAVISNPSGFSHVGFRGRCYAEILNATNYIVKSEEIPASVRAPFSYEYIKTEGDYSLYKSNRGVSLVYYYDSVISYDTFLTLDPLSRETNMMYSMVIDNPQQTEADIFSDLVSIPFEIVETENVSINGNTVIVNEDNGYIVLDPEHIEEGQISIFLSGLTTSTNDYWYYRNAVRLLDSDNNTIAVDASAQSPTTAQYYYGNDDIIISFESIKENVDKIRIAFTKKGEYNLDGIYVYSRPEDHLQQTVDAFYEHAEIDNITYEYKGNHLNIFTTTDSDKYLFVAIPYSEGWSAEIDGAPAEVIKANVAFMAIPISSGTHTIEMTYTTPYLYTGLTVSAVGIVLYIGYLFFEKKILNKT